MPWRDMSVIELREEFVRLALAPGANRSELCRRFGISRCKGYKWLGRFAVEGCAGLQDRVRRPHESPARTQAAVEAHVLRLREASNNAWGGRKIARALADAGMAAPAPSTVTQILRRSGKLETGAGEHPGPFQRFERAQPNELWQMDFKGHFGTGAGRCHPLTVLDDHSRFALGIEACANERDETVRQRLTAILRRYGLPVTMLMDNGSPWGDPGGERHTAFTVWLMRLGIGVTHGRHYHPQTQGKAERFHRSLKAEVLNGRSFSDLGQCQRAFTRWRGVYNSQRPHEALGLDVPACRYRISRRRYPEQLPPVEYGPHDIVRKVDDSARVSFKSRAWRIGKAFRGQFIALRPAAEDGMFTVHFCACKIGTISLKEEQPLSEDAEQSNEMFKKCD
jgi:transposase InsO family protein